jgi:hypothetical protein
MPEPQPAQPAQPARVYDADQIHQVRFTWIDGNFEETREIAVPPLPDQHAEALIDAAQTTTRFDKKGRRTRETSSEVDRLGIEIFNTLCPEHAEVPDEIKLYVLNSIWLNVEAERPIFKSRTDPFAPPAGQTCIQLTIWNGESTEEWEEDEEDAPAQAKAKARARTQPYLYFRTPNAEDKRQWLLAVGKPQEKFDKKGRLEKLVIGQNTGAIRELLFGSEAAKRAPLFVSAANYTGAPKFFHLFKALAVLFEEDVRMGESSTPPRL